VIIRLILRVSLLQCFFEDADWLLRLLRWRGYRSMMLAEIKPWHGLHTYQQQQEEVSNGSGQSLRAAPKRPASTPIPVNGTAHKQEVRKVYVSGTTYFNKAFPAWGSVMSRAWPHNDAYFRRKWGCVNGTTPDKCHFARPFNRTDKELSYWEPEIDYIRLMRSYFYFA
jgi:hypothetical protein